MFAPEAQENIVHFPQSTFFTRVVIRGILGHYVATAAGHRRLETINNFHLFPHQPTANPPSNTAFVDGLKIFKKSCARDKNVQELAATLG
jgi:hypothetical protein